MTYQNKHQLVIGLQEALGCDFKSKKESRFNKDTNSLYSDIQGSGKVEDIDPEDAIKKLEIPLEEKEYAKLLSRELNFYITRSKGYLLGKDVTFREHKNFRTTGRIMVKTISQIEYGTPEGLIKEGYCVFGWR